MVNCYENFYIFYNVKSKPDKWDSVQKVRADDKEYAKSLFNVKFNRDDYFRVEDVVNQVEYDAILKSTTTY